MGEIEGRILCALQTHLLAPEIVETAVEVYRKERARLAQQRTRERIGAEKELAEIRRKLSAIVKAIEDGAAGASVRDRLRDLEARREILEAHLRLKMPPADAVELHPKAAERYRQKVAAIHAALKPEAETSAEITSAIRDLLTKIVAHPHALYVGGTQRLARGSAPPMKLDLVGDLAALLGEPNENASAIALVAGGGIEPPTYGL
ncbi:MAG: hypothetical protein ACREMY_34765, partial [bacterium]